MPQAPILPYTSNEVRALADEVARSQTTVTGVQPKLSLDFDQMSNFPKRFTIVGLWGRVILKPQTERYLHLPELKRRGYQANLLLGSLSNELGEDRASTR